MKSSVLLFIFSLASVATSSAQVVFQKTYTFPGACLTGNAVLQTYNGGIAFTGSYRLSCLNVLTGIILAKTDADGNLLWHKIYNDDSLAMESWQIEQTSDRGFLISGSSGTNTGSQSFILVKTDSIGNLIWTKKTYESGGNNAYALSKTNDGGFIMAGSTVNSFSMGRDVYVVRTDQYGDTLWTKAYDAQGRERGYSISQTFDGGFIITGGSIPFVSDSDDVYVLKIDSTGSILWSKSYGGSKEDEAFSVQQTPDSGFVIAGRTYSFGVDSGDAYLIKTDANGDALWSRTYGGIHPDDGGVIKQSSDGGYFLGGTSEALNLISGFIDLLRLNNFGDTLWTRHYKTGMGSVLGNLSNQTLDRGCLIIGTNGNSEIYLIKTDSLGNSGCNEFNHSIDIGSPATIVTQLNSTAYPTITNIAQPTLTIGSGLNSTSLCFSNDVTSVKNDALKFIMTPNPASTQFDIQLSSNYQKAQLEIYNLLGEKIFSAADRGLKTVRPEESVLWRIDCRLFPSGVYFVALQTENGISVQKLIKQ